MAAAVFAAAFFVIAAGTIFHPGMRKETGNPFYIETTDLPADYQREEKAGPQNLWGPLGSCSDLGKRTVILSVLVDSAEGIWNEAEEEDQKYLGYILHDLWTSTEWLKARAAEYGRDTAYYYFNWKVFPNLLHHASAGEKTIKEVLADDAFLRGLAMQLDAGAAMKDYGADNFLVLFLFRTGMENDCGSRAFSALAAKKPENRYEFIVMPAYYRRAFECPAVYAHELLHLFGAQDLYLEGPFITKAFAEAAESAFVNDIMYTQSEIESGKYANLEITNEFSALDAYYTFLGPEPPEVGEWGLGIRQTEPR